MSSRPLERSVWLGVGGVLMVVVQTPLAVLFTVGLFGFIVLLAVVHSLGMAIQFDLFFLLCSALYLLPAVVAYMLGALVRVVARLSQSDSWLEALTAFAGLAVVVLGFNMFSNAVGWSGLSYWAGWVSLISFLFAYVCALVAGWKGALRGTDGVDVPQHSWPPCGTAMVRPPKQLVPDHPTAAGAGEAGVRLARPRAAIAGRSLAAIDRAGPRGAPDAAIPCI